ncbi:MAG: hypothetical protein VYC39_19655 [Myxococcota bacterium]|nr:hypothetical protein [Myxococcota bacterium]
MNQTAKFLPKKNQDSKKSEGTDHEPESVRDEDTSNASCLKLAPEPVDRAADTTDIRPPASSPPPNPGVNHEDLPGAPLEEIRFRLTRHRAESLQNTNLHFVFFDSAGRLMRVPVLDFSERGIGLETPEHIIFRSGEILSKVEIHAGERCVYSGDATVIHHPNRPDRVGIKLAGTGLDVEVLLQNDKKAGRLAAFELHLNQLREQIGSSLVSAEYRGLISDMVTLLVGLKNEIEILEQASERHEFSTSELQRIEDIIGDEFVKLTQKLDKASTNMSAEEVFAAGQYAKRLLHPLLLNAPIPARAYNKPLGYAGDYMLMELIYRQRDAIDSIYSKIVNRLCCRLTAAKAVVARVDLLTSILEEEVARKDQGKVRIGSMACGPAEEIQRLFQRGNVSNSEVDVALIDQDREALSYCSRRMLKVEDSVDENISSSIGYFHTSVKTIVSNPKEVDSLLGKFDVLYTVGLFDYLAAPAARAMIKSLSRFLSDKGVLIVGNFAPHDGQAFMEHILDWRLLYRTPEQLLKLGQSCLVDMNGNYDIEVVGEENETHLFMLMRKK